MIMLVVLLCLSISPVFPEDLKDLSPLELIKLGQDITQFAPYDIKPDDVQFYLLTKSIMNPTAITLDNNQLIDDGKETKILIHGWLENHKRSWYQEIAEKYLEDNDLNIVEVDWEKAARMPYVYSARSTKLIGNEVARFIESCNLSTAKVHIIGHSLGSHVAGFAGKKIQEDTGKKVRRITGLDPAGPYFRRATTIPNERLDKNDASIVDALHTDAGYYGYENPIGTIDIYVNGGQRIQPGCINEWNNLTSIGDILEKSFCSHARSTKYFIEWISNGKFKCKFCQSIFSINFYGDRCTFHHSKAILLGADDITESVTGICFTKTNQEEPYLN